MKYFIIAGEASGDLHAAELIRELKKVPRSTGRGYSLIGNNQGSDYGEKIFLNVHDARW